MRTLIFVLIGVFALAAYADTQDAPEVSPWEGTWVGSENTSMGGKLPVTAKIKVTGKNVSGTWNAKRGLQPIMGQVDGKEASISILQGGGLIKATLVDENTFKYSGMSGYGTLTRQSDEEEKDR